MKTLRSLLQDGAAEFQVSHFHDLPEFGSDDDFAAVGVTIDGEVHADNCVLKGEDGWKPSVGDTVRFELDESVGGFPVVRPV